MGAGLDRPLVRVRLYVATASPMLRDLVPVVPLPASPCAAACGALQPCSRRNLYRGRATDPQGPAQDSTPAVALRWYQQAAASQSRMGRGKLATLRACGVAQCPAWPYYALQLDGEFHLPYIVGWITLHRSVVSNSDRNAHARLCGGRARQGKKPHDSVRQGPHGAVPPCVQCVAHGPSLHEVVQTTKLTIALGALGAAAAGACYMDGHGLRIGRCHAKAGRQLHAP